MDAGTVVIATERMLGKSLPIIPLVAYNRLKQRNKPVSSRHEVRHPGPWITTMRLHSLTKFLMLCCMLFAFPNAYGQSPRAVDAPAAAATHAATTNVAEQLRIGLELEQNRQWLEAVQHYERPGVC